MEKYIHLSSESDGFEYCQTKDTTDLKWKIPINLGKYKYLGLYSLQIENTQMQHIDKNYIKSALRNNYLLSSSIKCNLLERTEGNPRREIARHTWDPSLRSFSMSNNLGTIIKPCNIFHLILFLINKKPCFL